MTAYIKVYKWAVLALLVLKKWGNTHYTVIDCPLNDLQYISPRLHRQKPARWTQRNYLSAIISERGAVSTTYACIPERFSSEILVLVFNNYKHVPPWGGAIRLLTQHFKCSGAHALWCKSISYCINSHLPAMHSSLCPKLRPYGSGNMAEISGDVGRLTCVIFKRPLCLDVIKTWKKCSWKAMKHTMHNAAESAFFPRGGGWPVCLFILAA